jgi:hypothetical protein
LSQSVAVVSVGEPALEQTTALTVGHGAADTLSLQQKISASIPKTRKTALKTIFV